MKVNYSAN